MASTKFIEGVGGKLADRWVAALFTPAFVFWFGGGLAALQRLGWDKTFQRVADLENPQPLLVAALALLVVAASGFVAQQFEFTVVRLLEGYWPDWCRPLYRWGVRQQKQRFKRLDRQYQDFNRKGLAMLTPEERQEYIQVDLQLAQFPDNGRLLPTRLGNILRSAEDRCAQKYGLDAIICWPRLWLVLPDGAKAELTQARNALDLNARLWLWSLLFVVWFLVLKVSWLWLLGLLVLWVGCLWLAQRWILQAAQVYGELLESAFDLYRFQLYEALRWPLPTHPAKEQELGRRLTIYLMQGYRSDRVSPAFVVPKS